MGIAEVVQSIGKRLTEHPNWKEVMEIAESSKFLDETIRRTDEERGREITNLLELPFFSAGAHRLATEIYGYVVKIPLESYGFQSNEVEKTIWQHVPESLRPRIVPYYGGDWGYAVYRKAVLFDTEEEFRPYVEEAKRILAAFEAVGILPFDCEVERFDQWGLVDGRLIILDTGEFVINF